MQIRLGPNFLDFTLTEKVTLDDPEFVLIITNDSTGKKVACKLGVDQSSYPDRYNRFLVTVISSPTALNAEVNLDHYGWHKYYVYEMVDADTFNYSTVDSLDLDTMDGEVEQGKLDYIDPVSEKPYYINRKASIIANGD